MCLSDNLDRWEKYDAEMERRLNALPKCHNCEEPIQQEDAVCIDGKYYCDGCLENSRVLIID